MLIPKLDKVNKERKNYRSILLMKKSQAKDWQVESNDVSEQVGLIPSAQSLKINTYNLSLL